MNIHASKSNFNNKLRLDRAIDQLLGICSGLVADASLNDHEISFLRTWLLDHKEACECFPGDLISDRLEVVMADGVICDIERTDLVELLTNISGQSFIETGSALPDPQSIPCDDFATISFPGKTFCFTGKFAFGTRGRCESAVMDLGAETAKDVIRTVDYLVIGSGISPDWKHESYGRKIERAIAMQKEGHTISIIDEQAWVEKLNEYR